MSTLPSHALADVGARMPPLVARVFAAADIRINGSRPWDMRVHHPDTFARIAAQRSLGLGESYMDGWWDCAALDQFFFRLLTHGAAELARSPRMLALQLLSHALRNRQSHRRAWRKRVAVIYRQKSWCRIIVILSGALTGWCPWACSSMSGAATTEPLWRW